MEMLCETDGDPQCPSASPQTVVVEQAGEELVHHIVRNPCVRPRRHGLHLGKLRLRKAREISLLSERVLTLLKPNSNALKIAEQNCISRGSSGHGCSRKVVTYDVPPQSCPSAVPTTVWPKAHRRRQA